MKTIFGIDPGVGRTGYGVIRVSGQELEAVAFGVISTPENTELGGRLVELEQDLQSLLEKHEPDLVVIEGLLFTKNVSTGIAVGQARGVALLTVSRVSIPVLELTPSQVKLAVTGYGAADKLQVQDMVMRLLKLKKRPTPDDAADALALAICGANF